MLCSKPLRDGPCQMDSGHKGRCSTVAFYCDGCGNMRRGHPHAQGAGPDGVAEADFCWFCCNVGPRN